MEFRPQLWRKPRTFFLGRNISSLQDQWILLRAPKSAKLYEALLGGNYYQCYPGAALSQQKEIECYDDTKIISIPLPSYFFVQDSYQAKEYSYHGTILSPIDWWRDSAERRRAWKAALLISKDEGTLSHKSQWNQSSAIKAAGFWMSCFPGVIYLFDVMSLINCSNNDTPWLSQVYSDAHHCLLEQQRPKPSIFVRDCKLFSQLNNRSSPSNQCLKCKPCSLSYLKQREGGVGRFKGSGGEWGCRRLQNHVRESSSQEACPSLFSEIQMIGAIHNNTIRHFLWTNHDQQGTECYL